jgi:hypothetical protein
VVESKKTSHHQYVFLCCIVGYLEIKECSLFSWTGLDGHSGGTIHDGKNAERVEDLMQGAIPACVGDNMEGLGDPSARLGESGAAGRFINFWRSTSA